MVFTRPMQIQLCHYGGRAQDRKMAPICRLCRMRPQHKDNGDCPFSPHITQFFPVCLWSLRSRHPCAGAQSKCLQTSESCRFLKEHLGFQKLFISPGRSDSPLIFTARYYGDSFFSTGTLGWGAQCGAGPLALLGVILPLRYPTQCSTITCG